MSKQHIIEKKKQDVEILANDINQAKIVLLLEYQGLKVQDLTELRVKLREFNSKIKLYSNNIIKRSFMKMNLQVLVDSIKYPKALLLGNTQNNKLIKFLYDNEKKSKFLKIISGLIEKKIYSKDMINDLANLPSKEELLLILIFDIFSPLRELIIILDILSKKDYANIIKK
ncbi:50S ribosomal protein L10 [Candidatus Phytoplasma sacchari]|uniref:Large ribosomal subunit protein uL10 n=1 Tax=Candidatus Phytoplasma sacchari TaxID=2609813 RepID=A0ABY7M0M3_9MOLU|nr:50S ribosomal protein L10 [Candidatus Phytoplasma sacchari]